MTACLTPTGAGYGLAAGAAPGVTPGSFFQGQAQLVGQGGQPGEDVAQFVQLLARSALAHGLGQLAHFLGQPGDGGGPPPLGVALPVGPGHQFLELPDLHGPKASLTQVAKPVSVLARLTPGGPVLADPRAPFLRADDLGVLRGDGVFERFLVRGGKPRHLGEHLARLARSARLTDMAVPGPDEWEAVVAAAIGAWTGPEEWEMRLVCTRGPEGGGPVTAYALGQQLPENLLRQRREGISVVSLYRSPGCLEALEAPWLLLGAKTLSYAVNLAARRYAARQGADDALFVDRDGAIYEGPTSALVVAFGRRLASPPPSAGILDSISTARLLEAAAGQGWAVERRPLRLPELFEADGVWFCSSLNFARAHTLDGKPLGQSEAHGELAALAAAG